MWKALSAVVALILCLSFSGAAEAQQPGARGSGFFAEPSSSGDINATYLTLGTSAILNNERVLTPNATYFAVTDNGPGGTYQLSLQTLPIGIGGSGATTAQGAVNNYLDGIAGAAAASGDTIYRNGSTWTRLAKGADGTYLTLSAGVPTWGTPPSGAPAAAEYVVSASDAGLPNADVLTQGTGITITNGTNTSTVAINSTVTTNSGSQTLTNKTLTSPIFSWNGGAGVQFNGSASNHLTFTWADWAGARAINFPDPGTTSATQVLLNRGNQTINGVMTFTGVPVIAQITNTGTLTLPTSTDTLIGRATTDTLTNKTITSPIMSASIVLDQTTQDYTITWADPAAARAYGVRDVGSDAHFAMTATGATYNAGGLVYAGSGVMNITSAGSSGQTIISAGTSAPSWGTLGMGGGGTGITSYTAGDVLTVNDSNTLVKLAGGTNGDVLTYDSTGNPNVKWAAPSAGSGTVTSVALTVPNIFSVSGSPVTTSGTLAVSASCTTGDIIYGSASNTYSKLAIGSTDNFLTVTGGIPAWASTLKVANGGTNTTSYTKGDILVASASTTLTKLAVGADGGTFLKAVSSETTGTKWSILKGIDMLYGDEADGAITISGATTYSGPIKKNATTFTVNSSQTLTLDTASPIIINCTSTATVTGTITATGAGGAGGNSADNKLAGVQGGGPGGGGSGSAATGTGGGGGGGCGGRGGRGYIGGTAQGIPGGGSYANWLGGGSGGGSGNGDSSSNSGSTGGAGGPCLMIIAKGAISMASGTITLDGAAGSAANAAGGGGGSGGILWTISDTSASGTSGTVNARGGNGGNGTGSTGGGSGGGGRWYRWSPSNSVGSTSYAAGTPGTNAEAGDAGSGTSIGGNPTLPLLTWFCDEEGSQYLTCMEMLNRAKRSIHEGLEWNLALEQELNQRTAAAEAAHGDLQKYAVCAHPGFKHTAPLCKEGEVWKNAA